MEACGARAEPRSGTYRVNGIDMYVSIAGHGPDVLLVHGFPDTHAVWRKLAPSLVAAGYRVIAPDTRGAGASAAPARVADYRLEHLVADMVALLDVLGIARVRLVAHDWGAVIGWRLVALHPERVVRYVALSVGHPCAYVSDPWQRVRAYYIVLTQLRGVWEWVLSARGFLGLGLFAGYADEMPSWRANLARPGRLTAALNYYRANVGLLLRPETPAVRVPVLGVWSSGDRYLTERQMVESGRFVDAPWRYARIEDANHWLPLTASEALTPLLLEELGREEAA